MAKKALTLTSVAITWAGLWPRARPARIADTADSSASGVQSMPRLASLRLEPAASWAKAAS